VWPPALEGDRFSFLYVFSGTINTGFHQFCCFSKRHAVGKPGDLGRVYSEHREDDHAGLPDQPCNAERLIKNSGIIGARDRVDFQRPGRL